jgi:O-antigen ligase
VAVPLETASQRLTTIVSGENNPYDSRPLIWAEAQRLIWERPVLGWGPGILQRADGLTAIQAVGEPAGSCAQRGAHPGGRVRHHRRAGRLRAGWLGRCAPAEGAATLCSGA